MTDCLFECLREARLETYYKSFVQGGVRHCEALVHLHMQDYPKYGVSSMDDRLKLFKLIEIVKSVQAEGLVCQHGKHSHVKQHQPAVEQVNNNAAPRKQTNLGYAPVKNVNNRSEGILGSNNARRQLPSAPQQFGEGALRRSASMRQVHQPEAGQLRRSASMRQPNAPVVNRRSASATRVEYKPGSDSPIFHCRKHLKFTDSDIESSGDEDATSNCNAKDQVNVPKAVSDTEAKQSAANVNGINSKPVHNNANVQNTVPHKGIFSNLTHNNQPLHMVTEPKVRTFNIETDAKQDFSPVEENQKRPRVNDHTSPYEHTTKLIKTKTLPVNTNSGAVMVQMEPKNPAAKNPKFQENISDQHIQRKTSYTESIQPSLLDNKKQEIRGNGEAILPSRVVNSQSIHISAFHAVQSSQTNRGVLPSQNSHPQVSQPIKGVGNVIGSHIAPSIQTGTTTTTASQSANVLTINSSQPNMANGQPQQQGIRPFQFKNFVPSTAHQQQQPHSYFPTASQNQAPHIAEGSTDIRTLQSGGEYNYGVPSKTSQNPVSQTALKTSAEVTVTSRIRVCVRKRPLLLIEADRGEVDIVDIPERDVVTVQENKTSVDLTTYVQQHAFKFDAAFGANCGNHDIYEGALKPLIQCAFNKGTATCFAFGQTGSGKSYTLLGNSQTPGLYQLAANDIFQGFVTCKHKTNAQLHLWVSYYEIYCSQLFDLLNKRKKLHIRENSRGKVCIAGLMETEVQNVKGLIEVVQYGNAVRSIGVSGANSQSSRSHAVLQLEVRDQKDIKQGRMSFIDLAGSERATDMPDTDKQTRLEGAEINQSLLALKECIRSIDQDNAHTPYRQSKLTHILRDSFLGDSQTVMIANIAPTAAACDHTLNTLRYADRVKELENPHSKCPAKRNSTAGKTSKPATPKTGVKAPTQPLGGTTNQQTDQSSKQITTKVSSAVPVTKSIGHVNVQSDLTKPQKKSYDPSTEKHGEAKRDDIKTGSSLQTQQGHASIAPDTNSSVAPGSTVNPFMSANIVYASTPKRAEPDGKRADLLASPFDVSKILKDEGETPVRGHKIASAKNAIEDSPEIIPAGNRRPTLEKLEVHSTDKCNEGLSENNNHKLFIKPEVKHETNSFTSAQPKAEMANTVDQCKPDSSNETSQKIEVDRSRVNDMVRQQRETLASEGTTGHQSKARRPLSADRHRSESRSPSRDEALRGSQTDRSSRSPTRHRQEIHEQLAARSKSIESLRASLAAIDHAKAIVSTASQVSAKDHQTQKTVRDHQWSPRSNHAQLRSQLTTSTGLTNYVKQTEDKPRTIGNLVIKSQTEIIAEHREVLNHIDGLLDRAKAAVDVPVEKLTHERPLKSILKNCAPSKPESIESQIVNDKSLESNKKQQQTEYHDTSEESMSGKTRNSNGFIPDVRPKDTSGRSSWSSLNPPHSRPPSTEEFLKSLADINKSQAHRQSMSSVSNRSASSSKGNTPGSEARLHSSHSSATRTPSGGFSTQVGTGFVTPAATSNMIGYVSGNDVIVITDGYTAFGGSPLPRSGYVPPPAPRKTTAVVNRAANDIGFKAELERMENCPSREGSDQGSFKGNKSWHDILSQSDEEGPVSTERPVMGRVSVPTSREGSLEMHIGDGYRQVATIKDADTVIIEMHASNGRSTVDSGISTNRDQSDPEGDRATYSRGSHYSLDLHSDLETADDGISLSTDNTHATSKNAGHTANVGHTANSDGTTSNHVFNNGGARPKIRSSKSVAKRQIAPDEEEEEMFLPPLKLNFDEDDDDVLEESYCRALETEKKREAEHRAARKQQLQSSQCSSSTSSQSLAGRSIQESAVNNQHMTNPRVHQTVLSNKNEPGKFAIITSHVGSAFSPIQPFPVTSQDDKRAVPAPTAVLVGSSNSSSQSTSMGSIHSQYPVAMNASSASSTSQGEQRLSVNSMSAMSTSSVQARNTLQQALLASHEEQLAQMTALCKQEMKLLMAVKNNTQDITSYVRGLEEILSDKGRCILHLKAKIDQYLHATQTGH